MLPVNIVFAGNSMTAGAGATAGNDMPSQVMAILAGPASKVNCGVNGYTWREMNGRDGGSASAVDSAWVPGARNVLVCWETTNAVFGGGGDTPRTTAQAIADSQTFLNERLSANPWTVVMVTALPRGGNGFTAQNQTIVDINAHHVANFAAMGAHAIADNRQSGSVFNFFGDASADFMATQAYWNETSAWTHPNDAGYAVCAGYIAVAIQSAPIVQIRATVQQASPTQLAITFSDVLDASSVPATSAFAVTNSGGADNVTGVALSGQTLMLTKSRITMASDVVSVAYTMPGSGRVRNLSGQDAPSFTGLLSSNLTGELPFQQGAAEWWDPSFGTTVATGVSQWVGRKSGSVIGQVTGSQQPTVSAINGHTALLFSRTNNQRLTGAAAIAALLDNLDEYTVISVAMQSSPVNTQTRVICGAGTVANTSRMCAQGIVCGAVNTNDTTFRTSFVAGTGIWGLTHHVQTSAYDGLVGSVWLDGVLSQSSAKPTIGGALDEFVVGACRITNVYANHFEGLIGDLVVFPRFLNQADRQAAEAWMAARYL